MWVLHAGSSVSWVNLLASRDPPPNGCGYHVFTVPWVPFCISPVLSNWGYLGTVIGQSLGKVLSRTILLGDDPLLVLIVLSFFPLPCLIVPRVPVSVLKNPLFTVLKNCLLLQHTSIFAIELIEGRFSTPFDLSVFFLCFISSI